LPLYHAYGQQSTIIRGARVQPTIYVMSEFRFELFLSCIEKYKITDLAVVPPILVMLAKRPETKKFDLSSLQRIGCGAAPLKKDLQHEIQNRFNLKVRQGWGMTELTCSAIQMSEMDEDRGDTVGRIQPNCELKLVDDDGKEAGKNQPGEILFRGPQVCMGYWRNEKATKELIDEEGWLKTGDIAVCNEDGYIWIVDRKKVTHHTQSFTKKVNI
jgi:acyl-CoA synthetase (AMP-forming)/AMP-acid ligase II